MDGKYSSGHFTGIEGIFFEKNLPIKMFLSKKKNYIFLSKKTIYCKKKYI